MNVPEKPPRLFCNIQYNKNSISILLRGPTISLSVYLQREEVGHIFKRDESD